MNQKLIDYEKVLKVIRSCNTNAQNQIAYRVIWNFSNMYGDNAYMRCLFDECDSNLLDVIGEK